MKCNNCHTYVTKIPVNWKCPFCGERLPDPSKWSIFWEGIGEYLQERGAIFWSITFGLLLLFIASIEALLGTVFLFSYIGGSLLISLVGVFYTGMLIDMIMKINLPLRLMSGHNFLIKERAFIRNTRKATNAAAVVGLLACLIWAKPRTFLLYFPSYPLVISWFLALVWAVISLFYDPRMTDDVRFRAYMDRLGITSLKHYRRASTYLIGALVVSAITFNVMLRIPGVWVKFSNLAVVGFVIQFFQQYFSWML